MTISSTGVRFSYSGNGSTTVFSFPRQFFLASDLDVYLVDNATGVSTLQALNTHYTVSGAGSPSGGSVTMLTAPATGKTLTIVRDTAASQGLDLDNVTALPMASLETALDRAMMAVEEDRGKLARTLRLADGEQPDTLNPIPNKAARANKYLSFDANGDPAARVPSEVAGWVDYVASAQGYATAAGTSATAADTARAAAVAAQTASETAATAAAGSATAAAGSATAAATSKTGADTAKTGAEAARTGAESARDAAFGNANVYADTTAGLAATTSGQQFMVVSGNEIVRYTNSAGTAVEVARYPAASKVTPLLDIAPYGYAFGIVDAQGQMAFGIKGDGTVQIASLAGKDPVGFVIGNVDQTPYGYKFAFVDQFGVAAFGLKNDGTVVAGSIEAASVNGVPAQNIVSGTKYRSRFPSEINMVLSYGQSLSTGTDGTPPITTIQRFDNLRFAGGVRSQDSVTPYTALVPLIETTSGTAGQTPIGGATDMIKELIASEDSIVYTQHSFQLLGSAPGEGGLRISQLIKGTSPYARFVADVQNGFSLAQTAGKSFKVGAFLWTQGESDYQYLTAKNTYKTALTTLRTDIETDVKAVTGQTEPVVCISYQTQAHSEYGSPGNPYIAVAQYEVARDSQNHYIACPLYWSGQNVHQSARNYQRLGAYYGLAYKRIIVDGIQWKPVMPVQIDRQGTIILARFNVPKGPLVLDVSTLSLRTNYGFSVVDSSGSSVTISSVSLIGPDTVKIVTATAAPGGKLRYGYTNGGNLRDNQGATIFFDGGGPKYPMHNWCVIFEEAFI